MWFILFLQLAVQGSGMMMRKVDFKDPSSSVTVPADIEHYTGAVQINYHNVTYYYFATSRNFNRQTPLIIHIGKGQGCTSFENMFDPLGIFNVAGTTSALTWTLNADGLHTKFNVLYIESPIGVGYSFNYLKKEDRISNTDGSIADLQLKILEEFYNDSPQYTSNPLYVYGGSKDGAYSVVALAEKLLARSEFKGIIIDSGSLSSDEFNNMHSYMFLLNKGYTTPPYDTVAKIRDLFLCSRFDCVVTDPIDEQALKSILKNKLEINNMDLSFVETSTAASASTNKRTNSGICSNEAELKANVWSADCLTKNIKQGQDLLISQIFRNIIYHQYDPWRKCGDVILQMTPDALRSSRALSALQKIITINKKKVMFLSGDHDGRTTAKETEDYISALPFLSRKESTAPFTTTPFDKCNGANEVCHVKITGAGHWPAIEKPKDVLKAIEEFTK